MYLFEKYKPKNIDEVIGLKREITFLKNRLELIKKQDKFNPAKNILILVGTSGCGKTMLSELLLNEFGYDTMIFDSNNITNTKIFENNLINVTQFKNIDYFFNNKKKALLIDEMDTLICCDRGINSILYSFFFEKKKKENLDIMNLPIFITIGNKDEKKFSKLKKKVDMLKFSHVQDMLLLDYFTDICEKENINISSKKIGKIIKGTNNNIRKIFLELESYKSFLKTNNSNSIINISSSEMDLDSYDESLFNLVKLLYFKRLDLESNKKIAGYDLSLIPLLFHENINIFFKSLTYLPKDEKNKILNLIYQTYLSLYIFADGLDNYTQCSGNWTFYDKTIIFKTGFMNLFVNNNTVSNNVSILEKEVPLKFTQILTKASLSYNFMKKKNNFYDNIEIHKEYQNELFLSFLDEFKNINKDNINEYCDKFKTMGLTKESFELMTKFYTDFEIDFPKKLFMQIKKKI